MVVCAQFTASGVLWEKPSDACERTKRPASDPLAVSNNKIIIYAKYASFSGVLTSDNFDL